MTLKTTPLHAAHQALGAKLCPFAGYEMPLYYELGALKEHEWVRSSAGLFDVSHMGQIIVEGAGAAAFWERLTPSAFEIKKHGRAQYTTLMNENGGIIDDLIITRLSDDKFFAVINAGCKDKDIVWIEDQLPADLTLTRLDDRALIALQGGEAEKALQAVLGIDLSDLKYMSLMAHEDLFVSRLGYTGEDGLELSVPADKAEALWNKILEQDIVKPVGLAARDSLRLEMGYPLYGHDIDETTSPVEAGLNWIVSKNNTGFIGADRVLDERENGPKRVRIGLKLLTKGLAREGAEILSEAGDAIGALTSGGFSPALGAGIGMGYVEPSYADIGTKLALSVRGRALEAEVVALPFVPAKTKSMK